MANANEEGSEKPSTPEYVTKEEIGNIVNSAVTNHLKRSSKSTEDAITKLLDERLKAFMPQPPPISDVKPPVTQSQPAPELAAMQAKYAELESKFTAEQERRTKAEQAQREDRAYGELKSLLNGQVRPEMLDIAADYLFTAKKRVEISEDGTPLFRGKTATGEDVHLPMEDGVMQFLKSKEGASFVPAPTSAVGPQTGNRRGARVTNATFKDGLPHYEKPATSDEEKVARAFEMEQAILRQQAKK
jgi:hypothetical protein